MMATWIYSEWPFLFVRFLGFIHTGRFDYHELLT